MESEYLERLREISFYLRIVPKARQDHAVAVDVLIKFLSSVQESFSRYSEAVFKQDFISTDREVKKIENSQFPLLVVDLKYESFGASLAPDFITPNKYEPLMKGAGAKWKKETFQYFKEDVLYADVNSPEVRNRIKSKFTEEERRDIFGPIYRSIHNSPDYNVIVKPNSGNFENLLRDLPDAILGDLTPPAPKQVREQAKTKIFKGYLEVDESSDEIISKKSIRKIIAATPYPMDAIPYYTDSIILPGEDAIYLNSTIEVEVSHDEEEDLYHLSYEPLNISVWGDSREEAIEAFNFTFISLYESYGLEDDANLTDGAIQLKQSILGLIKSIGGLVG